MNLKRRAQTATVLARQPSLIPAYLVARRAGRYPSRRYDPMWEEIRRLRPRRILEVGVFQGETARRFIELALPGPVEYWGFDLFEDSTPDRLAAEIDHPPLPLEEIRAKLERPGVTVTLVKGDTCVTLAEAQIGPVDFAFIDGGHSYATVTSDWANVQRLTHENSVVMFDDYTNEFGVRYGYGVRTAVHEIDRSKWDVQLLQPADKYVRSEGVIEHRLVRVTPRPASRE